MPRAFDAMTNASRHTDKWLRNKVQMYSVRTCNCFERPLKLERRGASLGHA